MKKVIFASALFMLGIFTMQAQVGSEMVQWGVTAGANFSSVTSDQNESPDSRTGFHAGIMAEVPMTGRFSIQPELYYSQQGFEVASGQNGTLTYELDYIQVPVLLKYYLVRGLNIHVGPQIGFLVNNELSYDGPNANGSISGNSDDLNDIDFDLVGGIGYKFNNGIFINGRYMYGLTNLSKSDNADVHNSVFQVGVGYMF